jgi:Tfp pilus assembly protein PilF
LKQYEKAIVDYSDALAREPKNGDAYAGRGLAYYAQGKTAAAQAEFQKACSLGSESGCRSLKTLSEKK